MINQKELESKVRHIQVHSSKAVISQLAGEYRSRFKGMGVEFEDVRSYQPGDDVRTINWNVTARVGSPHVKTYMEERDLTLYFLIDVSASTDFGSREESKREAACRIFALLAFAASHSHDNVGLILFSDQIELHVRARKGKRHVMRMIDQIMQHQPQGKGSDIASALEYYRQVKRQRCVSFLFSDFLADAYHEMLGEVARVHDLICVAVHDQRERELPRCGMLQVIDAETGELRTLDCNDAWLRQQVEQSFDHHVGRLQELCLEVDADLLSLRAGDDYLLKIIEFFRERNQRSANAS